MMTLVGHYKYANDLSEDNLNQKCIAQTNI